MRNIAKWILRLVALGIVAVVAGAAVLLFVTRNVPPVPLTVANDPDLPVITLSGVDLHGTITGREDAPLVIVLHGGPGGDHRSLLPLAELSDQFRVLFFDQRGAGLSQRLPASALTLDTNGLRF